MKAKEFGYILAIDQASNLAGVSLWHNGELAATTVLRSKSPNDPFSRRLQDQVPQLTAFLDTNVPKEFQIETVLFEGVRSRLVVCVIGAFLTCPRIHARISERASFIESSSWKRWAYHHGATGQLKLIKGVHSLQETGFDTVKHNVTSEDVADSIMIYKTWVDRP